MSPFEELVSQIPIRHNLISIIMILGIVQGYLLSLVIALRSTSHNHSLRILGWFIFILSLICTDGYLCYTGLMKYTLHVNDSTEFLVLLLGPFLFFVIRSLLQRQHIQWQKDWPHFLLPGIYFLFQLSLFFQPIEFKLNAYAGAYHPDLTRIAVEENFLYPLLVFQKFNRYLQLGSFLIYFALSARIVYSIYQKRDTENLAAKPRDKYVFSRNTILMFLIAGLVIFSVYFNFETDLGDHYIMILTSFSMYSMSFFMLSESRLFQKSWILDKYETSGLTHDPKLILDQAKAYTEEHKYFLNKVTSLKDLAARLSIPANYLSQSINSQAGSNFNEWINSYRIEEAKQRLIQEDYKHLSIEGIGLSVGFKSKSAFYAAFKKQTGQTPSSFVKANQTLS